MRHIKETDLLARINNKWHEAAGAATEQIKHLSEIDQGKFIAKFFQDHYVLWSELKDSLAQPQPPKCWYSEVQKPIPELEIDHFRPKRKVAGTKHKGYWWLAFQWQNFRVCSSLANKRRFDKKANKTLGKGTQFPLLNPDERTPDTKPASTSNEKPVLLDPFKMSDVQLLDYSVEDGKVVETYSDSEDAIAYLRANVSIELYHLNEGSLIARRGELAAILRVKSDRLEELWNMWQVDNQLTLMQRAEMTSLQNEIGGMINATAEYSAFCRAFLIQLGERGWNTELIRCA